MRVSAHVRFTAIIDRDRGEAILRRRAYVWLTAIMAGALSRRFRCPAPVSRSGVPRARCLGRSGASDDPSVLWRQEGVLVVQ